MAESSVPQVLLTGATGYVASHIIKQLLTGGQVKVRGTVRSLSNEAKVKPLQELVPDATYPLELVEADLLNEDSWKEAVKGCTYVLHVASPIPLGVPNDPNELIVPAVNGTLNVLKACAESGTVKRVVLTSTVGAISGRTRECTEADWNENAEEFGPYFVSKVRAERAAWDFVEKLEDDKKFELAVINPGLIIGPILMASSSEAASLSIIKSAFDNTLPGVLELNFTVIDVRDVAAAHIIAMTKPEAPGNRYILANSNWWMKDVIDVLREEFAPYGYAIKTRMIPKPVMWILKFFNQSAKITYPLLGKVEAVRTDKMRNELEIEPIDITQSILDTSYSLIEFGCVPRKPGLRDRVGKDTGEKATALEENKDEAETTEEAMKEEGNAETETKAED